MNFVKITTTQGETLAVNPTQIVQIFHAPQGIVLTMVTDRRITTKQFRSVTEAIYHCTNSSIDISGIKEIK